MANPSETQTAHNLCWNSPLGGPVTHSEIPRTLTVADFHARGRAAMADLRWPNGRTLTVGLLNDLGGLLHNPSIVSP